jgi:CBS domain-containing protein
MGFTRVYDYVGGKKAWLAAGLSVEGEKAGQIRSGELARPDPPTCSPDDTVADLGDRDDFAEWGLVVVVDGRRVVHGLLAGEAIANAAASSPVETVMTVGPTTIRPSRSRESALDLMDDLETNSLLVTTEFGELLGVLYRNDALSGLATEGESGG